MERFQNRDYTLRQLQYATAVAELGGFSRAATACGVSQPSLSAQVARLEDALGVQLFERHARAVVPTGAGRELLARMKAVLLASETLDTAARGLVDPYSVTLRVGVIPTVAPYLLPGLTERLLTRSPAPRIQWREVMTEVCERELAAGQLDAVLIADPPSLASAEHRVLGFEPFVMLVPSASGLRGPVTQDQVAAQELLLLEEGHCLRDQALAYCAPDALPREAAFRATSLATLVQMVAAGLGASVVPASALPVETRRAAVRAVPFADPAPGRVLRLAWRSRSPLAGVLSELAEVAHAALGDVLGQADVPGSSARSR